MGVESLIFLGHQYESLRSYLEHLTSASSQQEQGFLHQFYTQTITSAVELRKPIFMAVVAQAFDIAVILNLMNRVNWEVRDVMSQHSNYIDTLLVVIQDFVHFNFSISLLLLLLYKPNELAGDASNGETPRRHWKRGAIVVPSSRIHLGKCCSSNNAYASRRVRNAYKPKRLTIYSELYIFLYHRRYSNAKKCSNGGRGLMQLDFTQFKSKFEKIARVRPMPHSEYVELYIKAYYMPENTLEEWVKEHKVICVKQKSCGLTSQPNVTLA